MALHTIPDLMKNISFSVHTFEKIKKFNKIVKIDSDKSTSIRSFLIGAISENISNIKNVLESEDVFSTINSLKALGVKIIKIKTGHYKVYGKGLGSLYGKKNLKLNFFNSGTLTRLLIGILSTTPNIEVKIDGDRSLRSRDMSKLLALMSKFGAQFYPKNKTKLPIKLISSSLPVGINYVAGVSAQLKSAVILAAANSFGTSTIIEKEKSRNHTENIFLKNSKMLTIKKNVIKVFGKGYINAFDMEVPADPSSAAFFVALTILNDKSSVKIRNVGLNSRRIGFYQLLKKSGAKIIFKNIKKKNNENIGDVYVEYSKMNPIKANSSFYVSATDEYPIMFIIAALTPGISIFKGISELKNKESNRILEMQKILAQIGVKSKLYKGVFKVFGTKNIKIKDKKINVGNLGDHRIAMSAIILSLLTGIPSNIKNFETVGTSAPSFLKIIKFLGGKFEIKKTS